MSTTKTLVMSGQLSDALTRVARRLDVSPTYLVGMLHVEGALAEPTTQTSRNDGRRCAAAELRRRAGVIGESAPIARELLQIAEQFERTTP